MENKRAPRKLKKKIRKALVCHYGCHGDLKSKFSKEVWLDMYFRYNYYTSIKLFALEDSKIANQIRRLSLKRLNKYLQ